MNFKDIIKQSILDNFTGDMPAERVIIVLGAALVFGLFIFFIYRVAVNNEFYSKNFNKTLTLMSVVTAGIVLAIQSNLVISLGMVGALSIVRFRTAIKSSLDLFFLYWAISVGIICGAGLYLIACIVCIFATAVLFLLDRLEAPIALSLLVIHCEEINSSNDVIEIVKKHTKFARMKNKTIGKDGVELILEIKTKQQSDLERILAETPAIHRFSIMNFDRETRI